MKTRIASQARMWAYLLGLSVASTSPALCVKTGSTSHCMTPNRPTSSALWAGMGFSPRVAMTNSARDNLTCPVPTESGFSLKQDCPPPDEITDHTSAVYCVVQRRSSPTGPGAYAGCFMPQAHRNDEKLSPISEYECTHNLSESVGVPYYEDPDGALIEAHKLNCVDRAEL